MSRVRGSLLITLALLALVLLAWLPFVQQDLPRSNDGRLHLYRIIALDDAWTRDGHLYPRYASNLVYGYGAPLFNYFPPLAYIPGALLHRVGLSYIQSFQATMMGALFFAAAGMYALGSSTWPGDVRYKLIAGLGAAALYLYSPYMLFDAVGRGTLTEVVSLAVLPWVLWGMLRVAQRDRDGIVRQYHEGRPTGRPYTGVLKNLFNIDGLFLTRWWIFTGLLALFIPLHNVVTLHGGLLLIFVGVALLWQSQRRIQLFIALLAAGLMAGLMSLFFLAPALLEGNDVKIRAVTEALGFIDVTATLRPLIELFALPQTADPTNLQPSTPIAYSWPALILSLVSLWGLRRVKGVRALILALVSIFLLTVVLMWETSLGVWLWRTIPLLDYTQFAWRVLGIGSLVLAWLGGWGIAILIQRIDMIRGEGMARLAPAIIAQSVVLIVILLYGLPWTIARHEPIAANSIVDAQAHERTSGELALSSYSEYLPTWVETPPDPNRLQEAFSSGQPVPRLQEAEGVTVQDTQWGGTSGTIIFEAQQPTTLVFDWLYVPGWIARFTNDAAQLLPVSVEPLSPHGLVSVEVPAGSYTLEVLWQETLLQRTASLVSLGAWGLWLVIGPAVLMMLRTRAQHAAPLQPNRDREYESMRTGVAAFLQPHIVISMIIVGVGITLFKIVVIDTTQNLWRTERYASDTRPSVATFADQIMVREAIIGQRSIRAGETLSITVYWQVRQTPSRDESSLIELRDANGQVFATGGSFQPGGLAMRHWQPGTYVIEDTMVTIPADVPPGNYEVTFGLYDPISKEPRSVLNEAGNPQDVRFVIATVQVMRPLTPATLEATIIMSDSLTMESNKLAMFAQEVVPGQEISITPRWMLTAPLDEPVQQRWVWSAVELDENDEAQTTDVFSTPQRPLVPNYPMDQWQVGDVWRDPQIVFIPGDLETGLYYYSLELVSDPDVVARTLYGAVNVTAPERTFVLPQDLIEEDISWSDGIALQGYTGTTANFTLYWRTEQPAQANLRLSVQIVDEADQIIAQQDGVPVNWTRPVAGWAVGEVIATRYQFDLPEGEYRVRLVWYEAVTGERVMLTERGDAAVIDMN